MDKFNAFMQRKVFGIKVLYITAAFVVVLAIVAWKMKSAGPPADQVQDPDTTTDGTDPGADTTGGGTDTDGTGTVSGGGVGGTVPEPTTDGGNTSGGDGGGGDGGGGDDGGGGGDAETNDTWARKAIAWLMTKEGGSASYQSASSAIQKFLAGDQLRYAEGQLRDRAVKKFGIPPETPPVGGTATKPTKKPTTYKAPATHVVKGTGDNTFTELSRLYYRSTADKYIDLIQAHNTKLPHSGPLKKGTRVYIPKKTEPKMYTARRGKTSASAIAAANGISVAALHEYNDKTHFPVPVGRRVRVG